jgi:hypothetical protein
MKEWINKTLNLYIHYMQVGILIAALAGMWVCLYYLITG